MSSTLTSPRNIGLAAFAFASLGAISIAAANPGDRQPAPLGDDEGYYDDQPAEYDLDQDGTLEHAEIDYRHYDRDRNGVLDRDERAGYWNHMFDMGKLGTNLSRADKTLLVRLAFLLDRDEDGRLTRDERAAMSRIIRARQTFTRMDRNGDNSVTRREAGLRFNRYGEGGSGYGSGYGYGSNYGYGPDHYRDADYGRSDGSFFYWNPFRQRRANNWIAARFDTLDRNDNGRVSWHEVESHLIRAFPRDRF
jgi:Ca2+-binding EF-hand superfamily protein